MNIWPDNHKEAQSLADSLSTCRPFVGSTVKASEGKHAGEIGEVFWHGIDRYSKAFQYLPPEGRQILAVQGRAGFRVGIKNNSGEKFFVSADSVIVSVAA